MAGDHTGSRSEGNTAQNRGTHRLGSRGRQACGAARLFGQRIGGMFQVGRLSGPGKKSDWGIRQGRHCPPRTHIQTEAMTEFLLDANVLVRFLVQDDPKQSAAATALFEKAERREVLLHLDALAVAET